MTTEDKTLSSFSIDNFELELIEVDRIALEVDNMNSVFHEIDNLTENYNRDAELIHRARQILDARVYTQKLSPCEQIICMKAVKLIKYARTFKILLP